MTTTYNTHLTILSPLSFTLRSVYFPCLYLDSSDANVESFSLLQSDVLNPRSLCSKFFKRLRFRENKVVVFHLIPPTEQHNLLISFLVKFPIRQHS